MRKMETSIARIFRERPRRWGLRGDPFLWDDLERHFSYIYESLTEDEFLVLFYNAFHMFTGTNLESNKHIHILKYNYGGMSSGRICPEFWIYTALPMLTERLNQINRY